MVVLPMNMVVKRRIIVIQPTKYRNIMVILWDIGVYNHQHDIWMCLNMILAKSQSYSFFF